MKLFARLLLVTVGFGVLGFVMSLVPQRNATGAGAAPVNIISSVPLAVSGTVGVNNFPATLTGASVPVNVKQSANFKTLVCPDPCAGAYAAVFPDGSTSPTAFTIPQGEQFVITDVSWLTACASVSGCTLRSAGDEAVFELESFYLSVSTYRNSVGGTLAGHADHLTSGLAVSQLPTPRVLGANVDNEDFEVFLQGYLVP